MDADAQPKQEYEAPEITDLGSLLEVTHGTGVPGTDVSSASK